MLAKDASLLAESCGEIDLRVVGSENDEENGVC